VKKFFKVLQFAVVASRQWFLLSAEPDIHDKSLSRGQYFPLENRSVRLYSIRTRQGSVPFESTLTNDFSCWDSCK